LPRPLFKDPYSTVVNASNGSLLGAKIAKDGQWRFPLIKEVPSAFEQAILTYEDKRFYKHLGVDILALFRATINNIKAGKIESGASTLSMQVIRLSRKGKPRTFYQKIVEIILATRMELSYSKREILQFYTSHAPFGGNVVGLEAASWRYFRKKPALLSVSEAAMLAVLPNAPSLIHLSKNRKRLLEKRNDLLLKMKNAELIDDTEYKLALLESIPKAPYPLPRLAPHFVEKMNRTQPEHTVNSSIDLNIQKMLITIGNSHHQINAQSGIQNLSILVLDTETGETKGYLGNAPKTKHEKAVDMVLSPRSSGSVLKPILYAHNLDEGKLLPQSLIEDVPTQISGYSPKNYNRKYAGAIPADKAIAMSLNIPAVLSLQEYGVQSFLNRLREHGFSTFNRSADNYGLSLILGGGEVNLLELCTVYADLGRIVTYYNKSEGKYQNKEGEEIEKPELLSAGAVYKTFEAMLQVSRPGADGEWEQFQSSAPIAWKTGTSFGHRDAWAIGVSPKYTIGVWVGNADGESKHGLIGATKAGPILFDVVNRLEINKFFDEPIDDLIPLEVCKHSGYLAGQYCEMIDTSYVPFRGKASKSCPFHKLIHLDNDGLQVTSSCMSTEKMHHKKWFELPPKVVRYYSRNHPEYIHVPEFRDDCIVNADRSIMAFIYPSEKSKIYLPKDLNGEKEMVIFKASHRSPDAILFWHLDDNFLGSTEEFHDMKVMTEAGQHRITIVDEDGNSTGVDFEIVN